MGDRKHPVVQYSGRWMDADLQFYVVFNSISVISDDRQMIMKGCVQWIFHDIMMETDYYAVDQEKKG